MQQALRQQPRVRIEAPVAVRGASLQEAIAGVARNLSEGGLYVDTADPLPVGASVRCELSLDGTRITIPGEVAWTQDEAQRVDRMGGAGKQADARADTKTLVTLGRRRREPARGDGQSGKQDSGMGIRFAALSSAHRTLIRQLVRAGKSADSPVQLRFAGVDTPVVASAQTRPGGIRLRRALRFLELGSTVRFGFTPGHDQPYRGYIRRVELVQGERARVPILEIDIGLGAAPGPGAWPRGNGGEGRGKGRFGLSALVAVAALAGGAGAAATWLNMSPQGGAVARPAKRAADPLAEAALGVPVHALASVRLPSARAGEAEQGARPMLPRVEVEADGASVFVPMAGSDRDMEVYGLSTPGVAVNLPHASTEVPLDNFGIFKGAVTRVWMRPLKPRGVQVRVLYRRRATRPEVSFDRRGLRVSLE